MTDIDVIEDAEEAMDLDLGSQDVWDVASWLESFSDADVDLSGGGLEFLELTPVEVWLEKHAPGEYRYVNYYQHGP